MKRLGEESEDLLWRAEVVEEDVMRESVERAHELEEIKGSDQHNSAFHNHDSLHRLNVQVPSAGYEQGAE